MKKYPLVPIIVVLASLFLLTSPAKADWLLDQSGYLIQFDSIVLGDSDETENETENETEDQTKSEAETLRETQKQTFEQAREQSKQQNEVLRESAKQKLEIAREANKSKQKQKSEIEIESNGNRLEIKQKIEQRNGLVKENRIKMESDESLHIENEDGTLTEIKPDIDELELKKNRLKARTDMELRVGEKNEISVTLPNGKEREIKIPDQALSNLISRGIITPTEGVENSYELTAGKNGEPVYTTNGVVEKKLFGLFKMKVNQKLEIAASDAEDGSSVAGDIVDAQVDEPNPLRRFFARFAR